MQGLTNISHHLSPGRKETQEEEYHPLSMWGGGKSSMTSWALGSFSSSGLPASPVTWRKEA